MRKIALALMLVALTACGGGSPTTGTDSTGATVPSPAASTMPAAADGAASAPGSATGSGAATGGATDGSIEAQASAMLAAQLNANPDTLQLVSKEQTEWNDGSLGCPAPGMMYTQALVPGYKLTYNDGGRTYEIHTDLQGNTMVWCENGQPKEIPQP